MVKNLILIWIVIIINAEKREKDLTDKEENDNSDDNKTKGNDSDIALLLNHHPKQTNKYMQ